MSLPEPDEKPGDKSVPRIGERLQRDLENIIARYLARMRSDPDIPTKSLPTAVLEDHAMSFLSDLFQSLVILEKSAELNERDESELLNDGSRIQAIAADLHGRQRHRRGWTTTALEREYHIFREEIETLVKLNTQDIDDTDRVAWALKILLRQLERAREASFAAFGAVGKSN